MVYYGVAILALSAAATKAQPIPTYWPTYWPTYSPTAADDDNVKQDREIVISGYTSSAKPTDATPMRPPVGNPNYESSVRPTDPTPVRPPATGGNPNYESSEKPTDPTPERPDLSTIVTSSPTTKSPSPTTAPITSAPISAAPISAAPISAAPISAAPVSAAPVSAAPVSNPPTQHPIVSNIIIPPRNEPVSSPAESSSSVPSESPVSSPSDSPTENPITSSPTHSAHKWGASTSSPTKSPITSSPSGSSWGKPTSNSPTKNPITSSPSQSTNKWGSSWGKPNSDSPTKNPITSSPSHSVDEWGNSWSEPRSWGEASSSWANSEESETEWKGKASKWGKTKAAKNTKCISKASKAEWSTEWSTEWESVEWESPEWETGSMPDPPTQPANPIDAYAPRPGLIPESNPPESGPRCMRAILQPIEAGLEKYSGLGGDVLLAYNNAMPEFSTSASMGLEGGNFPPNIVGGFHIHDGTSCDNPGSHFFLEGWSNLGAKGDGDPWYPELTSICPSGAVYQTDASGVVSHGGINFANGYGYEDTVGKLLVLHDQLKELGGDYRPIACGVLEMVNCPLVDGAPRRKLYAWPETKYLDYETRPVENGLKTAPQGESTPNRLRMEPIREPVPQKIRNGPPETKRYPGQRPLHAKIEKEAPRWDDDGWSTPEVVQQSWNEPEPVAETWNSWGTAVAPDKPLKGLGAPKAAKLAKQGKMKKTKAAKFDCVEREDSGNGSGWDSDSSGSNSGLGWGWAATTENPTPAPVPCENNPSYSCEQFIGVGAWYCNDLVEGCADGAMYAPECAGTAPNMPGTVVCELYCNPECFTSSPSKTPSSTPSSSPSSHPTRFPSASPSDRPSESPSSQPTSTPSIAPSFLPSSPPTSSPTPKPVTTLVDPCVNNPSYDCEQIGDGGLACNQMIEGCANGAMYAPECAGTAQSMPGTAVCELYCNKECHPTQSPTPLPSEAPTAQPTPNPTSPPSPAPTPQPSNSPTSAPSKSPTPVPSPRPTMTPPPSPPPTPFPTQLSTIGSTPTVSKETTLPPTMGARPRSQTQSYNLGDDYKKDVVTECIEESDGDNCEFVCRETVILYENDVEIFRTTGGSTTSSCPQENS